MKQRFAALRYLVGALALNLAFGLVCLAQQAQGGQKPMASHTANEHVARLVADWTRARDYTKEYLDAMPPDGLSFRPAEGIRTFAEQMLHLTAANFAFVSTAAEVPNPYAGKNLETLDEYKKSKEALTKIVLEGYDFAITTFPKMDFAKINEKVKLFGRFEATRGVAIEKAFEHQTHHRGQTTIYLRLKGVKPPNEKLF